MIIDKEGLKTDIKHNLMTMYHCDIDKATPGQLYRSLCGALRDTILDDWMASKRRVVKKDVKTVYYISMEYLTGRMLGNNLINLKTEKAVAEVLKEMGIDLNMVEDGEDELVLGLENRGRLAACAMETLSTLGYSAVGCGIRYRHGTFRQKIENGFQEEYKDERIKEGNPFELRDPDKSQVVRFGGYVRLVKLPNGKETFTQEGYRSVLAIPYEIPIIGYANRYINSIRIWDAGTDNDFLLDSFCRDGYHKVMEEEKIANSVCDVFYEGDQRYQGKELRLKQEYFVVSASVQSAVATYLEKHDDIRKLPEKVVFQMNDTESALTVAELMRILMDEQGLPWGEAWEITRNCCAFTIHSSAEETFESWPVELMNALLPRICQIIESINSEFIRRLLIMYPGEYIKVEGMTLICDGQIRMANLAILGSFSVNGISPQHTAYLKQERFREFSEYYPDRFNNKTSGITQRRFLLHGNPELACWITERIGEEWIHTPEKLERLMMSTENEIVGNELTEIKRHNKIRLAEYVEKNMGIVVNPDSIFDVCMKNIRGYNRQLLKVLHILMLYNERKSEPDKPALPYTFFFGGKAQRANRREKAVIKLINSVAELINGDRDLNGSLKVVFLEDYCVTLAEMVSAAADIAEQPATVGYEACNTGGMKCCIQGAILIGSRYGANTEIEEKLGENNVAMFGITMEEASDMRMGYSPKAIYYTNEKLKKTVDQLVDGTLSPQNPNLFREIYNALLDGSSIEPADKYYVLKDFESYTGAHERAESLYMNFADRSRIMITGLARTGCFSSDLMIKEYVKDIWKLDFASD